MPLRRILFITLSFFWVNSLAQANECLSQMPAGVKPVGQVKICQSGFTGLTSRYSCQDYQKGDNQYRVIYKGGLEPKAIVKITADGKEQLIYSPSFGDHKMRCPLNAPANIPKLARHLGIGVCVNNNDEPTPCSVFEHAEARQPNTWRYLVFYTSDGKTELAHSMVTGDNHNAMVAEIAYQFGLSLLGSECCSEQATAYLEHAHRLFPNVGAYRSGYLDALFEQFASYDNK